MSNDRAASLQHFYFEEVLYDTPAFAPLKRPVPIDDLQAMAALVWKAERGRGDCPLVRAWSGRFSRYVYDARVIELSTGHRNLAVLLHELAHALGHRDRFTHGPAFRKRCLRLYRIYGGWSGEIGG